MIVIFLLLSDQVLGGYDDKYDCRNSTDGKKPGYAFTNQDRKVSSSTPNLTRNSSSFVECSNYCIKNSRCQLAEYGKLSNRCNMYFDIPVVGDNDQYDLFYWKFCNLSNGSGNKESMRGFWFYNVEIKLVTDQDLYNVSGDVQDCKRLCTTNPICGGFNLHEKGKKCQLLVIWGVESYNIENSIGWRGYYWVVEDPFTYKVTNEYCRYLDTKRCVGKWKVTNSNPAIKNVVTAQFQTRNVTLCYRSCEFYSNCRIVIYQYSTSTCLLIPTDPTFCEEHMRIPKKEKITIEWECCPSVSSFDGNYNRPYIRKCHAVRQPEYITLFKYNCSNLPPDVDENCLKEKKKYSVNCYEGQSFQSTGITYGNYSVVYNGYETLLIKNATSDNFPTTSYESCELYDARLPSNPTISLTLAKDWFSIYSNETNLNVNWPVKRIIVGDLIHHNCLCFEWLHCVEIIRSLQNKIHKNRHINIPFHFMISPSGQVFEGRGWKQQTKMFYRPNNPDTFYIAFIGNYNINEPTIRSMRAFRSLLKIGLNKKYISEEYYLVTDRDYYPPRFPYRNKNLYNVIRSQARYKGIGKVDCLQLTKFALTLNFIFICIACIIIIIISFTFYRWRHTEGCNRLRWTTPQSCLLNLTIFALSENDKVINHYNKDFENYIKSEGCFTNDSNLEIIWITENMEIRQCDYCLKKMKQTLMLFRQRGDHINLKKIKLVIKNLCKKETVCLIFQTQSAMSKTIFIIIHLCSENIVTHLKNIIAAVTNGKCLCSSYTTNLLNLQYKESDFSMITSSN